MKNIHILGVFLVGLLMGGSITFLIMNTNDKEVDYDITENKNDEENNSKEKFVSTVDVRYGWENTSHSEMLDTWKSGDKPYSEFGLAEIREDIVEYVVQEIIQEMAHQKIIADEKESSVMITPQRIDTLIKIVEEYKDDLEHDKTYLEILNRWRQGDFTLVDYEHNKIMFIQGSKSTEGLAKGIASQEQEKNYILHVFSKDVDKVFDSSTLKDFEIEDKKDKSIAIEDRDLSWVDKAHADMLDVWESGDETFSERVVQEVMLHMTHQKGEVDVKDGSIELTSERTDKLIQIVEEKKAVFQYYEEYLDILKRWEKGDFSTIYDDHERLHSFYDR